MGLSENIVAVITRKDGKKRIIRARNIVGDAGDIYYAQKAVAETPTNDFTTAELGDNASDATGWVTSHPGKTSNRSHMSGKISGTQKAVASGYPKTNDTDPDNTGGGVDVATWKFGWTKADFAANNIIAMLITKTSPGASEAILTGFSFVAAFNKTADDTLTVFVNHTMNGV